MSRRAISGGSLYAPQEDLSQARLAISAVKWIVMAITLGIYYLVPWLRWDRGPDAPTRPS